MLWLLLPFALEADLCEIVAAFLQTPLPKKEREVDVGEGKEKKRKEERRRGSWLVWKKMNTKHPLYQLGSAPFLPPFSLSTPSPSCACLSNLQPPLVSCGCWVLFNAHKPQHASQTETEWLPSLLRLHLHLHLHLHTPLPCLWLVVLFTAALQGSGGTCRWTFAPLAR